MKNFGKLLKAAIVVISFLLINTTTFAQCNGGFPNGVCDPGEDPACLDCGSVVPPLPADGNAPIKETAGDDPCTATPLKTGLACVQYSNDTSTTTTTPAKPSCWADAQLDVWFSFVATSQDMTVSTDAVIFELFPGTSNNDTEIALYSSAGGACGSLTEIGCDTDAGINSGINLSTGTSSPTRQGLIERTGLIPGNTYYIRVHGKSGGKGNFCVNAFDTYTIGSKPCEAQVVHPNNMACDKNNGNMVINTTSQGPGGAVVNTIQPGAYVPIGQTWAGCSPAGTAAQYGTWTTFTPESNGGGSVTVANSSGNAVDYTLFSGVCTAPVCIESKPAANGASVSFTGITAGKKYYILTTLQGGATTTVVKTDLCVTNASPPKHPETEKNEGGVPGAGGTAQSDHCPAFEIVVDQVYKTTTYAADKQGGAPCEYGNTTWFTWKVPSTYPVVNGNSAAFFQMWNKNCNSGPGSIGTRLIVGASILGDPCAGSCLEFSSPSQTGASGSSGDLDPYTDAATNVGWDPSKYGNQYWGMFQSGNDGSGNAKEVCDFNFMIGSTPSLKGIAINDATICQGSSATLTASGGTAYEWADNGSTAVSRTFSPTTTTSYTVTATAGADGYSVGTITVIPYPFTISVTPGAICSGSSSATLTATSNTTTSFATSYTWTPSTNLNVTTGATVLANPPSTRTYTVTGTIAASPSFAGCKASATSVVTVGGSIPVTVNNGTVCPGAGAVLTASGATTYTWTPATNLSATTGASVTATPSGSTTYTVRGENNGCFGTATSNVTISAAPTITSDNQTICSGSTATLTAAGGVSYVWQAGGATTNPFVTPALTSATNYTVTGTDAQGCKATAVSSVTMAPGLTITVNNQTICAGLTTTLTASGAATAGGPGTYTWQPGGFVGNPFTTPALSAPTTYTVTGTDIGGCTGSAVANVTIAAGLTITVSGNDGVCPGASNTLTAAGATNYTWSPPDFLDATTGPTVTSTPTTTTTYTVVGDANGCTGTATSTIMFTDYDDASFSYQSAGFCAPATAIATKNSPPIPASGTYSMTPTNELTLNTTTGDITVPAGSTVGPYVVTLMTAGACPNSYSLTINVVANPDATFSYPLPNYCKNGTPNPTITQPTNSTPGNFSATPAGMVFVSTTSGQIDLTASAPGNYTVTNDIPAGGGCPPTSATTTVIIDPIPTVTVSSTTVCAGTAGTITAAGATSYTWSGGFPAGASLTDTPGATTTYTATGTANGCPSTATGTIYVDQNPVVGVVPPPAAVCPGQSATMTATGANSYTWVGASGPYPSTPGLTDSPVATATYTVTGTIGICTGTATGTITVGSAPAITTADATICSGSTGATLTANGGINYTWSPGGGNTSSINVNPVNTTTYTVTGTGPTAGCDGVAYATVVVNTTPTPSVAVAPGTICVGQSSTLTASPAGAASYAWSSGGTGSPLTVTPATTTPYTVTVTSTENCSATASGTVNVNPIPNVSVNNATICAGETATLTAAGATTYAWSPNIGATASVSTTPGADASFTVTGTAAGCSNTAVSNVKVNPLPVVTVNDASICAGATTTLTASGANTYSWLPGGAVGNSINVNPNVNTPYTVVGTTLANCTGSAIGTVTAYPLPVAAFDDPLTVNLSEANILFRNTSTNSVGYLWDFGDTAVSIEESPQHQYADTGSYIIWLKVVSNGGCTDSIWHDITIVPDVLMFIPNAFSPDGDDLNDGFSFKSAGVGAEGFEFRIFDRWGEQMFYTNDLMEEWKGDNKGVACPQDVYVYTVLIKDSFGKEKKYLGWVTLVR